MKLNDIFHEKILLPDDVTTSGATLREAALALKTAGARMIIGLTATKA
jgi:predicted amidophosphoribosyltransferase